MIVIRGGQVYDPRNGVDGQIRDLWIDGERIAATPSEPYLFAKHTLIDAAGMIVAPAGVEIHTHVAGYALNAARRFLLGNPEAQRLLVPAANQAAEDYLKLGYTTVFDAASSPLYARATHSDLGGMAGLDRGTYTLMGDHALLLKAVARRSQAEIRDTIAWLLSVSGGFAVKMVNPGGGLAWKAGRPAPGLDEPLGLGQLTQRQIIRAVAATVNEMGLPHPIHLHAGRLGQPGAWKSFCQTVEALEGQRAHLCHIQFYTYGDDGQGGFTSAAEQVVTCLAQHPQVTVDVGQALFGRALAISADTQALSYLHALTRQPWISRQVEGEGGGNVLPLEYLSSDSASAVQWAVGLELMLRFPDPQRFFLTSDHPNGGPFSAYPQVIEWLMSQDARRDILVKIHPAGREKTGLGTIARELSLGEVFAMTSSGPAQALGLADRGQLGPGALADIRAYRRQANIREMFAGPAWVMRRGQVVAREGQLIARQAGQTLVVRPGWDEDRRPAIHQALSKEISIRPEHYGLGQATTAEAFQEVLCKSGAS